MRSVASIFSIALCLVTAAPLVEGQACIFGPGCMLPCNCAVRERCDPQTGCVEHVWLGKCSRGWDGPICQRQNVALGKPTQQSSTHGKHKSGDAVDGTDGHYLYKDGCTRTTTENHPYWSVTLERTYSIYSFQIYNRAGECISGKEWRLCQSRLNGFKLSVGINASQNLQPCYEDNTTGTNGPANTINGTCKDGPIPGDTVSITLPGSGRVLSLCEVKIFVCSPGTYGRECGQTCGSCAGQTACDAISGECPDESPRCMAGFMGPKCDKKTSEVTQNADYTVPIIGGVVCPLFLLAVVMAVIAMMRRLKGQSQRPIELPSVTTPESAGQITEQDESRDSQTPDHYYTDPTEEHVYVVVVA